MRIRVSVTDKDIAEGVKGACGCPISLALKRTLHRPVYVGFRNFCYADEESLGFAPRKHYSIPHEAESFIVTFELDGHKSVEPFDFMVDTDHYTEIDL